MFDAGALLFKIQAVGAQLFKRDLADSKAAIKDVEKASADAAKAADGQADAQDKVTKKTREAVPEQRKQTASAKEQADAAKKLSVALLAGGVALSALLTIAVAKNTEFDQAMSNTAAAIMATKDEHEALGEAALKAGADTAYSASEAAAAEEELAKAGLTVSDIIGGSLNGSLALAAAGQLQVARSAEIMATTLRQYKLPAEDAAHVSDLLAAGAGKAQGSVDDLALALQYVGPVASSMGLSLEETVGALALFASQGQLGERAGTGLRGVLMSLTSPSQLGAKTMREYGIEIFDAQGRMKSLSQVSQELKDAFGDLTEQERAQALGRIFGNEQITAARVLYEGGAKAVNQWTDEVNESGYAAEQAARRQDNLAGDIEKLGGAMDTALIRTGSAANDVLRQMVQAVTALVDWYGELPEPVQATALGLGAAAAAALLVSGAAVGLRVKLIELKSELDKTNVSFGKTAIMGAAAGIALTGIIAIVGTLMARQAEAEAQAQSYADTLEDGTQKLTKATREMIASNLTADQSFLWLRQGSTADAAEKLGLSVETLTEAVAGNADALERVNRVIQTGLDEGLKPMKDANLEAYDAAVLLQQGLEGQIGALDRAAEIARQQAESTNAGVKETKNAADAYLEAAGNADELNGTLQELIDTINEANGVGQDAITANLTYQDTLAAVDEQIRKASEGADGYALSLDTNTQAGRDNMSMLVDLAADAEEAARKQFDLTGNTDEYRRALEDSRQILIDRATQLGYNSDQAAALADQILRIPSDTEWEVIAETEKARSAISQFVADASARTITIGVTTYSKTGDGLQVQVQGMNRFAQADGGFYPEFFASGGMREDHRAQMVRAGAWRVFAEPETGGESYIPHAQSKRTTAVPVLRQTAGLMGYDLVPKGQRNDAPQMGPLIGSLVVQASPGMNEDQLARKTARVVIAELERKMK